MRRSERITAVVGAVLVTAASLGAGMVLSAHAVPRSSPVHDDRRLPADLVWHWLETCQRRLDIVGFGYSISQDEAGVLSVDLIDHVGESLDDPALASVEQRINTCLTAYAFESIEGSFELWRDRDTPERLVMFDAYTRVVRPCLLLHGYETPPAVLNDYLDPRSAPWADVYDSIRRTQTGAVVPFVELVDARRACGVPTQFLARGVHG